MKVELAAVIAVLALAGCGAPAAAPPAAHQTTDPNLTPVFTGTPGPVDNAPYVDPCSTEAQALPNLCSPTAAAAAAPTPVPALAVTAGQANAAASAAQYLSISPFSRAGLINQLSSSAVGFSLADATYGVDAQHADWNAQAALSAKQYLGISPFSRAGLINQLSSSAVGFTYAQAVYGVTAAGL
jgi:hypothetical protein